MKQIKKIIIKYYDVLIIILFISMVSSALIITKGVQNRIDDSKQYTTCEVREIRVGLVDVVYKVNGEAYYANPTKPFPNIYIGEIYKIAYNHKSPSEKKVLWSEPVIKDDEFNQTYSTSCKQVWLTDNTVEFTYLVDGKIYERMQHIDNLSQRDLKSEYTVKYKKDNPKIGYIFLN